MNLIAGLNDIGYQPFVYLRKRSPYRDKDERQNHSWCVQEHQRGCSVFDINIY